ncbi:MAG: hypothetical protein VKO64_04755 [Candidatus Sericytochromatia bacterium]|nr:hypothetical protein [Candidatus Sericytochromatia bacterium]
MRVLLRFLSILSLVVVLLGVRNADAACTRVCLHQGLAHPCSWARGASPDRLEESGSPGTGLSTEAPVLEEASMPGSACVPVRQARPAQLPQVGLRNLPSQQAPGPPIPPPRRANA